MKSDVQRAQELEEFLRVKRELEEVQRKFQEIDERC